MQFSAIALLLFSASALAAPVSNPEAVAEAVTLPAASADPAELFARAGKSKACCPKGKRSKCSPCPSSGKCPSSKPDQYSQCSNLGQLGLVNLLLCNVLSGNTINVPITLSLLNN